MNPFITFEKVLEIYISKLSIKDLERRWNEPHRHYHNIDHLTTILKEIEKTPGFKELNVYAKHALLLVAFFHDAVYNPKKDDNEEQSVKLFLKDFGGNLVMSDTVCSLIMTTKYRRRPLTKLKKMFWEADNAGFKKGYTSLMKSEKLIQKEYSHVPKEKFREAKIKFLESNFGLFGLKVDNDLKKVIKYYQNKF